MVFLLLGYNFYKPPPNDEDQHQASANGGVRNDSFVLHETEATVH